MIRSGVLSYSDLQMNAADIYCQMGYGDRHPQADVDAALADMLARIRQILRPRFGFVITEGQLCLDDDTLTVAQTRLNVGRIISHQLRGSEAFALFVATAGTEFEQFQRLLKSSGDMVNMFLADAVGSVIAEHTADCMEEELQNDIAARGWHHTNRFSPGYCGWHVSQQQLLFPLLGESHPCGISLTPTSLMLPIKSVSGVIGLGAKVRKLDYSCGLCDYKACYKRRSKH